MSTMTDQQIQQVLTEAGWPQDLIPQALAVIHTESGDQPDVIGWDDNGQTVAQSPPAGIPPDTQYSSYDTGLFQINSVHDPSGMQNQADPSWIASMQDPLQNAEEAWQIYQANAPGGSWEPAWTDSTAQAIAAGQSGLSTDAQATAMHATATGGAGVINAETTSVQLGRNPGFLKWLQALLNPQFNIGLNANPLDLFGIASEFTDTAKVAQLVLVRGTFVFIGTALIGGGIITLLVTAATSKPAESALMNVGRAQRVITSKTLGDVAQQRAGIAQQKVANDAQIAQINAQARQAVAQLGVQRQQVAAGPQAPRVIEHHTTRSTTHTGTSTVHHHVHREPTKTTETPKTSKTPPKRTPAKKGS